MGGQLFLCLPRVRSVAPSRAFPQTRLDCFSFLCHVFCVFASVRGPLYPLEGIGLVPSILRFGILGIQTTALVCFESICHAFSVLLTFQLSIITSSPLLNSPIGFILHIIENVRSIIFQWVHAMSIISLPFQALYGLSRVRSVTHWHGFPSSVAFFVICLLYTSPSPRDGLLSRMPSSA